MGDAAARGRFLELFANRDEKPTEAQTSILQALTLMNGPIVAGATSLETGDTLAAVAEAPFLDTAGRVEALYLAALTRRPRPDEVGRSWSATSRRPARPSGRSKALADVFWALLNGPEFKHQPLIPAATGPDMEECRHGSIGSRRPATVAPAVAPAGRRRASSAARPRAGSRPWRPTAAADPRRRKSCILLWMTGGPSQIDTFDPKPGHANGGPFKAIETAVPGIRISASTCRSSPGR